MLQRIVSPLGKYAIAGSVAFLAMPAAADVKAGVDAWSRGDYPAAVQEWEGLATAGDADAMFNMAQAYRLGRGVPQDMVRAESLYAKAAAAGHLQAADTYGLMLFQSGRHEAALPLLQDAARRGDPRAQYLLGIAHFNGDFVERDVVRAYALITLAHSAGLPQAANAIQNMDQQIPLAQRQQAASLAIQMKQDADAARATELAALDLGAPVPAATQAGPPTRPLASPAMRQPQALATTAVAPSVSAAKAAVAAAQQATGTQDPALAGASYAGGGQPVRLAAASAPQPAPPVVPAPAPVASAKQADGKWRVQLGAFSVADNAARLWQRLSSRPELVGRSRLMIPAGRVTKLQAGGFPTRASAESACKALSAKGQDCLVTDR